MIEIVTEKKLSDGTGLRVSRFAPPDESPFRITRYLMASLGYEGWRNGFRETGYWRQYYRESLAGNFAGEIADLLYLAEIDGQFASRMWFAHSRRSGIGNFGHVFTEPEFRQRGLMRELLAPCVEDFMRSPAKLLACATGSAFAARSYIKHGFELIYGGETGPLALMKPGLGTFTEYEKRAFAGSRITLVRKGTPGDQFDCDKFLAYSEKVHRNPRDRRVFAAAGVSDFRCAMQESLSGNGLVTVAENPAGVITGYAFILRINSGYVMDFKLHPDYNADGGGFLGKTAEMFLAEFPPGIIRCYLAAGDTERNEIARDAGFRQEAALDGAVFTDYPESRDNLLIHRFN
jgi:GNAT superfamily N-acetyltransferase